MPIKVTKDFIHYPAPGTKDSDFVSDFGRTIIIDKDKGIKGILGKLKATGKTRIRSYLFPTKNFTKSQASDWIKSHSEEAREMKEIIVASEAEWTRKYINDLGDGNFLYIEPGGEKDSEGKTKPRSLRHFPYKDANSKVDLPHLRNALARIPQSKLSDDVKKRIAAKARRIAKDAGIDVSESFLDDYELVGPLFQPYLESTLTEFNEGILFDGEYEAEEYDFFGRKLARVMNSWTNSGNSESEYDENGNMVSYSSSNEDESEREWEYHDGLVVRTKTSGDSNYRSVSEYLRADISETSEDDLLNGLAEEKDGGSAIKSMRMKKKMSRDMMSTKMSMSAARLREIEDGDDYDEDELGEIAKGLGISSQKLKRVMSAFDSKDESNGRVKIIDRKIKIVRPPFTIEKLENFKTEFYPTIPKHVAMECGYDKCHELSGSFILESIQEEKDGSLRFSVPLFKENELTHNNNRYTTECSENLLRHLGKLNKRNSTLESSFLEALKESVGESSNAAYVIESMKQQPLLMLASHEARQGKGNFLKDVAGRVLGGRREKIEGDMCFVLEGKTIRCPTGDQISGLMREGVMRGVSLFSYPFKFEDNKEGAHDVSNMLLVGADFTNEGGNLRHFKDKALAAPQLN